MRSDLTDITLVIDRFRGCLLGLAAGDAVGTTVEFKPRGSFTPLTDMVGGGPFGLEPGQWTDDTSMALCLGTSLLEMEGFDAADQMNRYVRWWKEGYLSSNGRCFDIGNTVRQALQRFRETGDPMAGATDPYSAGNGSIMRLAPVVLFFFPEAEAVDRYAAESSMTTHGAREAIASCRMLASVLVAALEGRPKEEVLGALSPAQWMSPRLREIAQGGFMEKDESEIRGTGYVVESLEAALWSFWSTSSFKEAILTAANLGDDADTTAAVCGQIAGAHYGASGIPKGWLELLAMKEEISEMALGCMRVM